jgi:Zn-dependent metalloprotease
VILTNTPLDKEIKLMMRRMLTILVTFVILFAPLTNSSASWAANLSTVNRLPTMPADWATTEVVWNAATGVPSFISGRLPMSTGVRSAGAAADMALAFLTEQGILFGITDVANEVTVADTSADDALGLHHTTLQQIYYGLPVYQAQLRVHLHPGRGEVTAVSSTFVPALALPTVIPQQSGEAAVAIARQLLPQGEQVATPQLVVYPGSGSQVSAANVRLSWLVTLYDQAAPARTLYVIDALNGQIVDLIETIHTATPLAPPAQQPQPDTVDEGQSPDIVGGSVVKDINTYPWMAALQYRSLFNLFDEQGCGGTLIYPRWILTAAHCVVDLDTGATIAADKLEVALGSLQRNPSGGERISVERIITNTNFNTATFDSDIALLKLVSASQQEPLVNLAYPNHSAFFAAGQPATVIGWGNTQEGGSASDALREVTIHFQSNSACDNAYNSPITSNMLCAGETKGGKDSCQGDSGGPLVVVGPGNRWLQAGIVSFGQGCARPNVPGLYTKVSEMHNWIIAQITATTCQNVRGIPLSECQALVLLYESTNGVDWQNRTNWTTAPDACTWYGITCENGRVTQIDLQDNNLIGTLPPELGNLTELRALRLSVNNMKGEIPNELGNLRKLQQLYLSENQLRGQIPPELGNLTQLIYLTLNNNKLTGRLPATFAALQQVKAILLSDNQLEGPIPNGLGTLPNLELLELNHNQIDGEIPAALGNLPKLTDLGLSHNLFRGRIPADLSKAKALIALDLSYNQLSEPLPEELSGLTNLKRLLVSHNTLWGSLPESYTGLGLELFHYNDTTICEPNTETMRIWLNSIATRQGTALSCVDAADAKQFATYSARGRRSLPGAIMRIDDQAAVGDLDVDRAHDFARSTYTYFLNTHGRNSFDNQGAIIVSTVHYGRNYDNAFWDGKQMVYGDGFPVLDVVGHELTHAVTEKTANLEYKWQSGALNESFSDIFGAMIDRDDWLMGEDLPPDALGGREAIRSLSNPAQFGQPAHTKDWVRTCSDEEGVHTNSGIFNKAYYNIATAIGKESAERIFYRALSIYLQPRSSFADARAKVLKATADLYGLNTDTYRAVEKGFTDVGLTSGWSPQSNDCTCAATGAVSSTEEPNAVSALQVIGTLYQVRDTLLSDSAIGQHYRHLYYQHTGQINLLLLFRADLRAEGAHLLRSFNPGLHNLVTTDGSVVITPAMVEGVQVFLGNLKQAAEQQGYQGLAQDLAQEELRLDWSTLAGMTFAEAWRYFNTLEQPHKLFMPIVEN